MTQSLLEAQKALRNIANDYNQTPAFVRLFAHDLLRVDPVDAANYCARLAELTQNICDAMHAQLREHNAAVLEHIRGVR